jgi:hypothetical protein
MVSEPAAALAAGALDALAPALVLGAALAEVLALWQPTRLNAKTNTIAILMYFFICGIPPKFSYSYKKRPRRKAKPL